VPTKVCTQEHTKQRKIFKKHNRNQVKSKRHGHPYLPPFGIMEKELVEQTSQNKVFAITTSWVMEENHLAIHSSR